MKGPLVILLMAIFVVGVTAAAYAVSISLPPILPAGQRSTAPTGASFAVAGADHRLGEELSFTLTNRGNYSVVAPCGPLIERLEGRTWHLVAPAPQCPGDPPRLPTGQSTNFTWVAADHQPLGDLYPVVPGQYRAIAKIEQETTAWSLIVGFTLS